MKLLLINQKGLAFHAEAKQKKYKDLEAPPFLLESCVFL